MTNFSKDTIVDISEVYDGFFLMFVVGLIKYHLDNLDNEYKDKFDVTYQWGGNGPDFIDLSPKENPDFTICIGTVEGLGYSIYLSGERGIIEESDGIDKEELTLQEVNQFCIDIVNKFFVNKEIEKYKQYLDGEYNWED